MIWMPAPQYKVQFVCIIVFKIITLLSSYLNQLIYFMEHEELREIHRLRCK